MTIDQNEKRNVDPPSHKGPECEASDYSGRRSSALARLRSRKPVLGALQSIPAPTLTELAVWSGFDFVILDCEHGLVDESAQLASLQVISGSNAFSVVRVRRGDFGAVGRYLDHGADGILLPDVQTTSEAQALVAAATHGPAGTRSSTGSGGRAARYGLNEQAARSQPLLMAMIEGRKAVANIDAIAATPGLSGLVIGPHDLSADLGCPNDFSTPAYAAAFVTIEQAAARAGLLVGSSPQPGFDLERLVNAGHCFILVSADVVALRDGFRAHLTRARRK